VQLIILPCAWVSPSNKLSVFWALNIFDSSRLTEFCLLYLEHVRGKSNKKSPTEKSLYIFRLSDDLATYDTEINVVLCN